MTTLLDAVRAVADNLGGWGLLTVTQAPSSSDPDARRTLISSELVDEDRDPTAFNDYTLYAVGGILDSEQVAVRRDMYDGTNGILYSAGLWSSPPQVGQEVEYHARLPRRRHFGEPGLREIVNQALSRLWTETETTLTGNGTVSYPAPAWLTSARQLVGLKAGGSPDVAPSWVPSSVTLVTDDASAAGPYLRVGSPYGSGEPFRLVARRPASTWIKPYPSAVYRDATAGLVDDADEAAPGLLPIATVATWLAYRALARRAPDFELSAWAAQELVWQVKAETYLQWGIDPLVSGIGMAAPAAGGWSKGWSPG